MTLEMIAQPELSETTLVDNGNPQNTIRNDYNSISFGFQGTNTYEHSSKLTDINHVFFNEREGKFMFLDGRGLLCWNSKIINDTVQRYLEYPKYQSKVIRLLLFSRKFNVYFAVCSDFTLKVYNKDFVEVFTSSDEKPRSYLSLAFNPVRDELIATGVYGTVVWKFQQTSINMFTNIKHMANYELALKSEHRCPCDAWCSKINLVVSTQQVYLCAETNLIACDAKDMRTLFIIKNAHKSALTCATFSPSNRVIITGSLDTEVKVWSAFGGHLCSLRGHTRAITNVQVHPGFIGLVFSSSMDGSLKVWSLATMDLFHTISVSPNGIDFMNITHDKMIWCHARRKIFTYNFTQVALFWGHSRCQSGKLKLTSHKGKTSRLLAIGKDGSTRLFSQTSGQTQTLCTVLPPPIITLTSTNYLVSYSRFNNIVYLLVNPNQIWIYTTKTDPACRIAEWNVLHLQKPIKATGDESGDFEAARKLNSVKSAHKRMSLRASSYLSTNIEPQGCSCITSIFSEQGFQFENDDGIFSARNRNLLLIGLTDGRIIFVDGLNKDRVYGELQVNKNAICTIHNDIDSTCFITLAHEGEQSCFQVWDLPAIEMKQMCVTDKKVNAFAVISGHIATGHIDGSISLLKIDAHQDQHYMPLDSVHKTPVIDVQACENKQVFCSCGSESDIKIWSMERVLLRDIRLVGPLSAMSFLNKLGDLVIGWKNQLYLITHDQILREKENDAVSDTQSVGKESFIYEDPAVKKELLYESSKTAIDIHNYLVPYRFLIEKLLNNKGLIELEPEQKVEEDDEDGYTTDTSLQVDTEIYFSATDNCNESVMSADTDAIFPYFGESPCSTPESTIVDEENDDISEFDESIFEIKEKKVDLHKEIGKAAIVARAIKKMKPHVPVKEKEEQKQVVSRFANISIDAHSLMKKGMTTVLATQKWKKMHAENVANKQRVGSGRTIIKKQRRESVNSLRRPSLQSNDSDIYDDVEEFIEDIDEFEDIQESDSRDLVTPLLISPIKKGRSQLSSKQGRPRQTQQHPASKSPFSSDSFARRQAALPKYEGFPSLSNTVKKRSSKSQHRAIGRKSPSKKRSRNISTSVAKQPQTADHPTLQQTTLTTPTEMNYSQKRNKSAPPEFSKRLNPMLPNLSHETPIRSDNLLDTPSEGLPRHNTFAESLSTDTTNQREMGNMPSGDSNYKLKPEIDGKEMHLGPADTIISKKWSEAQLEQMFLDVDIRQMYKDDSMKYESGWQDRVLEKHKLRKLQEKQRRSAALQKKLFLEQERLFKMYALHPELMHLDGNHESIEPESLWRFIINTLMAASKKERQKSSGKFAEPPRSVSAMSSHENKRYRFSTFPGREEVPKEEGATRSASSLDQPSSVSTLPHPIRTSSSIPGKTKYILLHPEQRNDTTLEPNKLESILLRNRFPTMYNVVSKHFPDTDEITRQQTTKEPKSSRSKPQAMAHWHDFLRRNVASTPTRTAEKADPVVKVNYSSIRPRQSLCEPT